MRLIDADDLKKTYYRELNIEPGETGACYIAFGMFPRMIDNARTINAEPTIPKGFPPTTEISVADEESLLIKTDWKIYGRFNRVIVTDGESHWKFYYKGKNEPKPLTIEPKRGRWIIEKSEMWAGGGAAVCSECYYGYSFEGYFEAENFKFCPNCGARMEASDD